MFKEVADSEKLVESFANAVVGAYFGNPGVTVSDPYFGGLVPEQK